MGYDRMKRILIVTGSRSDQGKLKQIALKLEQDRQFELFMFVTGMHLLNRYGATYKFVIKDGYKNIYLSKKSITIFQWILHWLEILQIYLHM